MAAKKSAAAGVFRRITAQAREGLGGEGECLCRAYNFAPSASQICTELLTSIGRRRAVDILAAIDRLRGCHNLCLSYRSLRGGSIIILPSQGRHHAWGSSS